MISPPYTGVLNLNIARLENHLKVLAQQKELSKAYPDYTARLVERELQVQHQLQLLVQHRNVGPQSRS